MKISKKILAVLLICILTIPMLFIFTACNNKKAIILVPGIGGSVLIDTKTKKNAFPPIKDYEDVSFESLLKGDLNAIPQEMISEVMQLISQNSIVDIINDMSLNDDGTSYNPNVTSVGVGEYVTEKNKYGPFNYYKKLYKELEKNYGKDYEITVFQYDWRYSADKAAIDLQNFIDTQKYKDVVFVSHSMGGLVVSDYLSLSEKNRKKVKLNISHATPYYGSLETFKILEDPTQFINLLLGDMDLGGLNLANLLIEYKDTLSDFISHLEAAYELIPSTALLATSAYNDKFLLKADGREIKTYDEVVTVLKTRPWAKKSDGSTLRALSEVKPNYDRVFKDYDGKGATHPALLVNTYFFYSSDYDTGFATEYNNGEITNILGGGDTIVETTSAILGKALDDERVIKISNGTHMTIPSTDVTIAKCIELIGKIK